MHSEEHVSLRERKRLKTRFELAETALELFSQHGYDNVTVDDIAAAVDISPRTFFRYYPTKEDVLFPGEEGAATRLRQLFLSQPPEEPVVDTIRNSLLELAEAIEPHKPRILKREEIISQSPGLRSRELAQHAQREEILTQVIAERIGTSPRQLTPRLVAATCVAAMRTAVDTWLQPEENRPLKVIVNKAFDQINEGLVGFTG